jgi:hypothetical protein
MAGTSTIDTGTKCLTLPGTFAENAYWNVSRNSKGRRIIPLHGESVINEVPMMLDLIKQQGIEFSN